MVSFTCVACYANLSLVSCANMNGNGQMEVHYIDTGFPYTATESFMDFFEGLTHAPVNYGHAMPVHDQACSLFFIYSMLFC